jgi:hypothetical protein
MRGNAPGMPALPKTLRGRKQAPALVAGWGREKGLAGSPVAPQAAGAIPEPKPGKWPKIARRIRISDNTLKGPRKRGLLAGGNGVRGDFRKGRE